MEFAWGRGRLPKTAQGYLRALPWQGERWYHVYAVSMSLQHGWSVSDLGPGLRASGRLPRDVFRQVLDRIETCPVDADVTKRGVNSRVGTLMIQSDYRYRVFTGSEQMFVPFQGAHSTPRSTGWLGPRMSPRCGLRVQLPTSVAIHFGPRTYRGGADGQAISGVGSALSAPM